MKKIKRKTKYIFTSVDYDTFELRWLAEVCLRLFGESRLAEAFQKGLDPHTDVAAQILGITYEEAVAGLKSEDADLKKRVKNARDCAKCFHPDTQVLTRNGWKPIPQISYDDDVASVEARTQQIVWSKPTLLTTRTAQKLIHLENESINIRVTEDHRMLGYRVTNRPFVTTPENLNKARYFINAAYDESGDIEVDERLLRLAVMTQADGNYTSNGRVRAGFKKERKIKRLRSLLSEGEFYETENKNGIRTFVFSENLSIKIKELLDNKKLPFWWTRLKYNLRKAVIDEAKHWDSHVLKGNKSYTYSSTIYQNIEVLQTIATITGYKSNVVFYERRAPAVNAYKLSIKNRIKSRGGNITVKEVVYNGIVYCLSVPSSFIIVKDKDKPVVVGQCANFGLPGGLGIDSLITFARKNYKIPLTREQALKLKEDWLRALPEMRKYFAWKSQQIGLGDAQVEAVISGMKRGGVGYCDGCNYDFQNPAAWTAKKALFDVAYECYVDKGTPLFGTRPVAFIHDEIIAEVPEKTAHEASHRLAEVMCAAAQPHAPTIPITASPALMRRWYKGAEAVYENGRLVPWQPKTP